LAVSGCTLYNGDMLGIPRLLLLALGLSLLPGCGETSITFSAGVPILLSADDLVVLEAGSLMGPGSTVATVTCPPGGCTVPMYDPISCNAMNFCDPDPVVVTDILYDLDVDGVASSIATGVDKLELLRAEYVIRANTFTFDIAPIEIYWGPPGAVDVDPAMGVMLLGTIPATSAGSTGPGTVLLDAAGNAALTDYLRGTAGQIRLFYRTTVDVDPGDPWPAGNIDVAVTMTMRATGNPL